MIPVIQQNDTPRYRQIYEYYREAILRQRLPGQTRLPSYRWLAKQLGVANNTILQAYDHLVAEGYVRNEPRKGLYVNKIEIKDWQLHATQTDKPRAASKKEKKLPFSASVHLVDQGSFPIRQWRKCSNWALDNISFQYQEHEGNDPLKEQLLRYLYKYRGVNASHEQLIVGSGASSLMFWLAFVLRKRYPKMLMEDPGYARVRDLFSEFGYKIKSIPVEADGIDVDALKKEKANLLYLTPSHQYPTGTALPVSRRLQVLDWAMRNKAFVIEDDFDCEFRYRTKLMPSLQALDRSGNVIYVGTFSSALMPSLRVGYMVLPMPLLEQVKSYVHLTNTVPHIIRRTLGHFMESGFWESNLRKMNKVYRQKYEACVATLKKLPADRIAFNNTPSGLNIFIILFTRLSEAEIVRRASEKMILITPASQFYHNKQTARQVEILFEFGSIPTKEIEQVIMKLYAAWFNRATRG